MKRTLPWIAALAALARSSPAQVPDLTVEALKVRQGFVLEGLGFSGSCSSVALSAFDPASGNPALPAGSRKPTLAVSYQFDSEIPRVWYSGVSLRRAGMRVPQSAAVVCPAGPAVLAAGFSQRYNALLDLGDSFSARPEARAAPPRPPRRPWFTAGPRA